MKLGLVFGNFFWRFEVKVKNFLRLSHLYKVPTFLLEKKVTEFLLYSTHYELDKNEEMFFKTNSWMGLDE